jgi:exodeoxyribonuclease (lambda-induced)
VIHHQHEQGSPEWIAARRGVVTGSRFKDCRAKLKNGEPSKDCMAYAYDIARERCGGMAPAKFQNAAMRIGTEQEAPAVRMYEVRTGYLTDEVGFFTTEDGLFGLSPDRLIDDDGVLEVKTLFSSATLFTALAEGDVSEYMDQCLGYLWLLGRQWVDLVLWVPDLQHMTIKRITRDENAIEALEADLIAFAKIVADNEAALRRALGQTQPAPVAPAVPAKVAITAAALPETIF